MTFNVISITLVIFYPLALIVFFFYGKLALIVSVVIFFRKYYFLGDICKKKNSFFFFVRLNMSKTPLQGGEVQILRLTLFRNLFYPLAMQFLPWTLDKLSLNSIFAFQIRHKLNLLCLGFYTSIRLSSQDTLAVVYLF